MFGVLFIAGSFSSVLFDDWYGILQLFGLPLALYFCAFISYSYQGFWSSLWRLAGNALLKMEFCFL